MTDRQIPPTPDPRPPSEPGLFGRRELVQLLALAPLPALLGTSPATLERAVRAARTAAGRGTSYAPRFFTEPEWETTRLLADLIIPRDARSGSATDAGVPEFMDTLLADGEEAARTAIRGGLAWLDREARRRSRQPFRALPGTQQTALLDDIAWPARARPEFGAGAAFFTRFRDLVAAGFWSSRMGVEDLGYQGNTFLTAWTGCSPEQLRKLGVKSS